MPAQSPPRFPLRGKPRIFGLCHIALGVYESVDKNHPTTVARLKTAAETAMKDLRTSDKALWLIPYPETTMLAQALTCLFEADDKTPELRVLRPEDRRDGEALLAALSDFNWTQKKFWDTLRADLNKSIPRSLNQAEREEQRIKRKRDAILREVVGRPAQVDIWGNVREPEPPPVDQKIDRKAAMVEAFKQAYGGNGGEGHHDLRKHAKTANFMPHPFERSHSVSLNDPDVREKVAEVNQKLREGIDDLRKITEGSDDGNVGR